MQRKTIKAKLAQVRRPPWQLLMTSVSDDAPAPIAGTNSAPQPHLRTILQLRSLTVRTTGGDIRVTRVFARGIATEADPMLAGILGDDQAVTGIVFPAPARKRSIPPRRMTPTGHRTAKHSPPRMRPWRRARSPPQEAIVRAKTVNTRS